MVGEVVRDVAQPLLTVRALPLAHLDRDPEVMLVWFDNVIADPQEPAAGTAPAEGN